MARCSTNSPELPPAGIWQMHPVGPLGPSSSSNACDGMCPRNALTCGTSSQSGRRTPSLPGHLCPASAHKKQKQFDKKKKKKTSLEIHASVERCSAVWPSPPQLLFQLQLSCEVERLASCDGRDRPSLQAPRTEVCHLGE